jgi:monoamine oxidase
MTTDVDVVIVGAGVAGIAAARRLATSGLSVVLLEASARVGGRAWTCDIAGLRVDLGCGWLHSADRNSWTAVAEASGFAVDRRTPAWRTQYRDLGFSPAEQAAASKAFADWSERLVRRPPASDRAVDVLEPDEEWRAYLQAMSGSSAAPNSNGSQSRTTSPTTRRPPATTSGFRPDMTR